MTRADISAIADQKSMAWLWRKHLRPMARAHSLPEFYLAHDALENLAYEWDLSGITSQLAHELLSYTYRAGSPAFVRGAKSVGLTRPIAHLPFRDALVYRIVVARAENSLAGATPVWARMGRRDEADGGLGGESGWFRGWLARQRRIWVMVEACDWLVESDVANYYPTVGVSQICDHVRSTSDLSDETVRLLRHVLERFSPLVEYRTLAAGGLAQEFSDSSRILAHSYLSSLDHAFGSEGEADRYTRWMDDVIVGADTWADALRIVRRIQLELEKLGLYPNASKTRIYRRSEFVKDYMKAENDFIGEIESQKPLTPVHRREFRRRLRMHVKTPSPRPKGWNRVLRRYYTNSRRLRDTYLLDHWGRHLTESPESAGHILEYVRTFPLTDQRVSILASVLLQFGGVYEDVEILAMEFLSTAPIRRDRVVRESATKLALSRIMARTDHSPEVAAAAVVAVAKLATRTGMNALRKLTPDILTQDSSLRRQLLPIAFGLGWIDEGHLRIAGLGAADEAVLQIRFLLAMAAGEQKSLDMTFGVLKPTERKGPRRRVVRPRLVFLAPILARADRPRFLIEHKSWLRHLQSNQGDLRDLCIEGWIRFARHSTGP